METGSDSGKPLRLLDPDNPVIAPMSHLRIPAHLDGHDGSNRGSANAALLRADTDQAAMEAFLAEYDSSPGTQRIYRREIERLMLWTMVEKRKPMSSLNREDFNDYVAFLKDPQPARRWCGPKRPQESADWRPFVGPLQKQALSTTLAVLNSFFRWLTDSAYLRGNPLGLIRKQERQQQEEVPVQAVTRYLEPEVWSATLQAVQSLPRGNSAEDAQFRRVSFWLDFLYYLAPRAGEMQSHRMNSFQELRGRWWWSVVGKGRKAARVPLPDPMVDSLLAWRDFLGLPPVPRPDEQTPLLLSLSSIEELRAFPAPERGERARYGAQLPAMTARQLNRVLKDVFEAAIAHLPPALRYKEDALRRASAHWGRHTSITAMVDAGVDPRYARLNARHADARTTQLYIHEQAEAWHEEAQKLTRPES